MKWLALDLGSTYTKTAVICQGKITHVRQEKTPAPLLSANGRYEIDAQLYYHQVENMLQSGVSSDTQGILISTQMHGYLLCRRDFSPLTPYISWRDQMGAQMLDILQNRFGTKAVAPSGVPLKGNLAFCSLLARQYSGQVLPDNALFCTLGSYIIGRLTGMHVCHITNAAPTGMADVRNNTWNTSLIHEAALDGLQFPPILRTVSPVGQWRGISVYPDLGDQQVCAYGAHLQTETSLHVSIGTAGLIGGLTEHWGDGPYENRPWIDPGYYLRTISSLPGGRHIDSLKTFLAGITHAITQKSIDDSSVWDYLASVSGTAELPTDIWGMLRQTPAELVLSIYTEFAWQYANASGKLNLPIRHAVFSGGCAEKNPPLRAALQRAFPYPCETGSYDAMKGMLAIIECLENPVPPHGSFFH